MSAADFEQLLRKNAEQVSTALDVLIPRAAGPEARLMAAMRYSALAGGKRMRPFFVMASGRLFGADEFGLLRVAVNESGALPVWRDFTVLPANVYDGLVLGSDKLDVDAAQVTANAITATALDATAAAELADAVWDEVRTGHTTAGTFGLYLDAQVSAAATPPTAAAIADAVWDESLSNHLLDGSAGDVLNNAGGATTDPWTAALPGAYPTGTAGWLVGQRLDAKVSAMGGNSPGRGAAEFVYTLTDAVSGDPIADADIWATTDSAGAVVVASGRTDQNGRIVFYLDPGPAYVWRQKTGWNFANPDVETVV